MQYAKREPSHMGNADFLPVEAPKGDAMRYVIAFCLFILLSGHKSEAQVLPASSGSCGISAAGWDCDGVSAITLRRAGQTKTADIAVDSRHELQVTRFIIAPGAPLERHAEKTDVLIVGMNSGEFVNENKSPQNHVDVSTGLVMLMPKGEPYLLRNIGRENLDLLMIEVRK